MDDASQQPCPIGRCADLIAGKWTLLVIRDLAHGPRYFSELETSLRGIAPRTLSERLRMLATHGIVLRTDIKARPPRTQYELTPTGQALLPLLDAMRDFAVEHLATRSA